MAHGDDAGLRVPPRIAATQVVVMVVRDDDEGTVTDAARRLTAALTDAGVRVRLDEAVSVGFGRRATDWELKGVPVRVEVGPRDLAEGVATVVRRDEGEKRPMAIGEIPGAIPGVLEAAQVRRFTTTPWPSVTPTSPRRLDRRGDRGGRHGVRPAAVVGGGGGGRGATRRARHHRPVPADRGRRSARRARTRPTWSRSSAAATDDALSMVSVAPLRLALRASSTSLLDCSPRPPTGRPAILLRSTIPSPEGR